MCNFLWPCYLKTAREISGLQFLKIHHVLIASFWLPCWLHLTFLASSSLLQADNKMLQKYRHFIDVVEHLHYCQIVACIHTVECHKREKMLLICSNCNTSFLPQICPVSLITIITINGDWPVLVHVYHSSVNPITLSIDCDLDLHVISLLQPLYFGMHYKARRLGADHYRLKRLLWCEEVA